MHLFLLPYFGGDATEWNDVRASLPNFSTTAYSWQNIGVRGDDYSVRFAIEDILKEVQAVEGDFILVSHSMGGKIALGVAAKAPKGLKGLILLAPSPPTPEPIPDAVRERMLTTHGTREAAIETLRIAAKHELSGDNLENAIRADLETSDLDWKNWLEIGSREDISDVLPQIHIPVLVLTGDSDGGMKPELMNSEIVSKIPGARLEIVPEAGHFLPMEAPGEVAAQIRSFARVL